MVDPLTAHRSKARWWVLTNAFLVYLVSGGFTWAYITFVASDIMADLDLELGDFGLLWGGIALGVLVSSIPAGSLGDRFGPRRPVGAGLAVCGAALLVRAAATSFAAMLASMVLLGCGFALIFATVPKAIGIWFAPRQLGLANGVSLAGLGVGQGIAALTTSRIAERLGSWRSLTEALGYVLMATAIYWLLVIRDAPRGEGVPVPRQRVLAAMGGVLRVRGVWVLALCYLLYLGSHLGVAGYLPTYFETVQGMSRETAGFVVSFGPWGFIVGSAVLPMLSDRIGLRKPIYVTAVCTIAVAVLAQAFLRGFPLVVASVVWGVSAGAVGLVFVVPIELDRVGARLAGITFGAITCFGFLGGWLFPAIGLSLAEVRPVAAFVFFSVAYVASALLFSSLPETGPRRRDRRAD